MGIKPSGDNPIIVPPDNIQSRWGEWEADLDSAGQVAGEVNLETWSLANSANELSSENAQKVYALLGQSEALGDQIKTIQDDYEKTLGEQGTITQSISDLSTELGNKVNSSEFATYQQNMDELVGEQGSLTQSISNLSEELAKKLDGEEFSRYQQTMENLVGEQGTITQSISNLSTDLDKKVNASTFTEYEAGMEEQLWGENGELWRINSVLWDTQTGWNATQEKINATNSRLWGEQGELNRINNTLWDTQNGWNATQEKINATNSRLWGEQGELNRINNTLWDTQAGWNATQEKLNTAQDEINTLNDQRNDLQDQVAALNTQMLESQSEFISRTLFAPGLQGAYDDYFSVTPSGKQWKVEAKDDWTGEYVLQSAYNTSRGWEPVLDFETMPREDASSPRIRYHNGAEYSTIIQYWVRQSIHRTDNEELGHYTTPYNAWLTRDELTFTAPIDADYSIYYRVVWDGTTYNDTYSFRVLKNGVTILQWGPMTHVGPLLPGESGRRTRTINELNVSLKADDVLTFQTYSDAGSSSQRSVVSSTRNISWLMPYGSTWVLDTDGKGGFLRVDDLEGTVDWNWQQSVRFLISDVVAGTGLSVWDGAVYVDTPAGTVIPKGAWIRTAEPHPSSVTFRKRS